ncbi:hypothetical protein [uncultured Jannaschia sp.]|uniref:hypothetical protein n=1 Tax=uncultured Jannaschia sp. TaxID=293347 RepID=UPI00261CA495|nr:hypothetical protein [uncultured Jannaschia sp.]
MAKLNAGWNDAETEPDMKRAVALRALPGLADVLRAGPALRFVGAGWPAVHLALVVLPGTEGLARRVPQMVDKTIVFAGCSGIPERPVANPPLTGLPAAMPAQDRRLALQL